MLSDSLALNPRWHDFGTESSGMQKLWIGGYRGWIGDSLLLASSGYLFSVLDYVLSCSCY